jgi:hypothetical protein
MNIEIRITDPENLPDCLPIIERALKRKHPHLAHEEAEFIWVKLKEANRPTEFGSYLNAMGWNSVVGSGLRKALRTYLKNRGIVVIPRPAKEASLFTGSHLVGIKRVDAVARKVRISRKLSELRERPG